MVEQSGGEVDTVKVKDHFGKQRKKRVFFEQHVNRNQKTQC